MSTSLAPGVLFADRYRVVRCIATGGMGAVYEVTHVGTNRRRALKVMHSHLFHSPVLRERFKREARVAAEIQSEYVVDVFDTGVDDATGLPFLVMELLQGEDLRHRLERLGRLSSQEVITYLLQVAAALDKSHAAGIVHRDLKPENLFLTQREDGLPLVKVLDFGVAKMLTENTNKLNQTEGIGTPLFMSPEQLSGDQAISSTADIHALAMVAYMLLVGTSYWDRELQKGNPYHLIMVAARGVRESAVMRAAEQGVTLPAAFDVWFAKATALSATHRFSTAGEAIAALERALGVEYDGPRPKKVVAPAMEAAAATNSDARFSTNAAGLTSSVTMSGRSRSTRASIVGGIAAVSLCAIGGAFAGWLLLRKTSDQSATPAAAPVAQWSATAVNVPPVSTAVPVASIMQVIPLANSAPFIEKTPAPPLPRSTKKNNTTAPSKKPTLDDLLGQH